MTRISIIFRKRFWIAFVALMMVPSAKCQQTDSIPSYYQIDYQIDNQIDYNSIVNRVKSCSPASFTFSVSMPSLEVGSQSWSVIYYAFVDDSIIYDFCSKPEARNFIPQLVNMISDDEYSWQINIMLYSITHENAIDIAIYAPNRVEAWIQQRREKDIAFWKSYLFK